ncbi:uncharacterized protein CDV56_108118 [Aspergillus thermomutatus]|uniref:Myb-like DNA-binding domain-containing protein n=1 Tax=Aspergillus thermomutatus TaxID=41047 RepID=A0A397HYL5_ASPTH|nr:uncharacterized protein CDV56_108118 [Aspergillus thermomutatus]RHZ65670.1 hypothetical protein CDV56_108118 [Aspergillus thermomutatus]
MTSLTKAQVDFNEVAKECNIVTKGAAAKRYERLIKAYNETTTTAGPEPDAAAAATSPDSTPKKTRTAKAGPAKKTKAKQAGESPGPAKRKAAGESSKTRTKKARVSKETVVESAERMVEQRLSPVKGPEVSDAEEEQGQGADATAVDGEALFDQFCNSEGDDHIAVKKVKKDTEEVA